MGLKQKYGLACPNCGQDEDLVIQVWGWHHVTDDEIYEAEACDGPYNWGDDSEACCWECGWNGKVGDCKV